MNVCVYCGTYTNNDYCSLCNEFDGIVTEEEWNKMIDEEESE